MKPACATAFCPGHISGYFMRVQGTTNAETGSAGAGIVISEGVKVTVRRADRTSVCITRVTGAGTVETIATESPLLTSVLNHLGVTVNVTTECTLPVGAGFGLSAAALLAMLTALNRVCDLRLTVHDIAQIAHNAEVEHRTGLGDVAACQGGGWVVRPGPGIDATIERRFDPDVSLYAVSFGPIHTPSVLGSQEQMDRVRAAFPREVPATLPEMFRISQQFAQESGLVTPEVRAVLDRCEQQGIPASMTMLGNGVFACGDRALPALAEFGAVYRCAIAREGARILGEGP